MDAQQLLQLINQEPEMNPDLHDGSYELMREIIAAYSSVTDLSTIDYLDLNAIYAMAIGTWKLNSEKKKEYVFAGHLPLEKKEKLKTLIDQVWDNACQNKYENREVKGKPSYGMFGTGFYSFENKTDNASSQRFVRMMIQIAPMSDDNQMFDCVESVFDDDFRGMQAAAASVMLHCLKPFTFPVINANSGRGTLFGPLGIKLNNPDRLTNYIDNCRIIKEFRDSKISFKNYRILDWFMYKHPEIDLQTEQNQERQSVKDNTMENINKNTILFGPPGTGKTYNTVIYAVAIIENKNVEVVRSEAASDYQSVKHRYDEYVSNGRIAFTTFHQSYGYEEFIEGIKPTVSEEDGNVSYYVAPGLFKTFCDKASVPSSSAINEYGVNKDPAVWKVSLGGSHDNPIRTECLENNHIRIGWDDYGPEIADRIDDLKRGKRVLNAFVNIMRKGDIVISCYSSTEIDAIGVVTGDYEWDESFNSFKRVRSVRWIVKNIRENIVEYNNGNSMTLATVYWIGIPLRDIVSIIEKYKPSIANDTSKDRYVFVIDEINRGNISKVFGELITLIEQTKRIGASEEMRVTLPYSHEKFGVPDNVYILGTMNTADRSIAIMDTALRRRFSFEEMMPDSDVLRNMGISTIEKDGQTINIPDMLDVINERIEFLYDREHTIGHAFFTPLKEDPSIERLASIFETSVIPLLQEYFYEDYGKIQLVLGDNGKTDDKKQYQFIRDGITDINTLFNYPVELESNTKYSIQTSAFHKIESYKLIDKKL